MRILLIITISLSSFYGWSQPGVAPEVTKNGKDYYEHEVVKGNTLWGLQSIYGVKVEQIIAENPELNEGLKLGQKVYIPLLNKETKEETTSEYKVGKSETLYGLSRKFNTTVDHLISLNPELKEGLKKGQTILVPGVDNILNSSDKDVISEKIEEPVNEVPNPFVTDTTDQNNIVTVTFSDSIVRHSVLAHETMYSISKRFMVSIDEIMKLNKLKSTSVKTGQVLIIPVKTEQIDVREKEVPVADDVIFIDDIEFVEKDEYKVAIVLPLYLDYGNGYSEYVSNISTQFYMGAKLALDTLEKHGLNAKVYVFDSKNDSLTVAEILNNKDFNEMDLVIGPLISDNISQVADYCKANKIRMVCPVGSGVESIENNPFFYSAVPSNIALMKGLAKFMVNNYAKDNIVLIKPLDKKSLPLYEAFRKEFNETQFNGERPHLIEASVDGFNTYIKRRVNTRFVVPSIDNVTAMKFMDNLNRSAFRSRSDDLFVYGTKEWIDFSDVNNIYKNKYNFHFPSPNHLDYYNEQTKNLNILFRKEYSTDLSKMAVQGYDVMLYFGSKFFLSALEMNLIMNGFDMDAVSNQDGFENTKVFIIEQDDFELVKVGESY